MSESVGDDTAAVDEDDPPDMGDLYDELEALADVVDDPAERERVAAAMRTAAAVEPVGVFGRVVSGFDRGDAAEALLGSALFGIPMLVEGGTSEVGEFLATHPVSVLGTLAFTVVAVVGILYVSDIQDVRVSHRLLGVVPRRLAGVLGISLAFAVVSMTAWGRVAWGEPLVAAAVISVAWVPMAIGAALGDILPGT
ncbi:TIGR02587 family membrane protein [Halorubellus salinus]|uniref:TIGR02587 family membrane protein n=1 Tax=Halorubellus salinus TaxID=755309 RepID=UPI001D0717E0|nr:TIGR02587 family membrane protein [Halorubellus salinus]